MSRVGTLVKKAQFYSGQKFEQPRLFVPAGCIVPETAKDTMARQLYQAGVISKDDYEKMLGVMYDTEIKDPIDERYDDEAFSAWEEEFELSKLAFYDDYGDVDRYSEQGSASTAQLPSETDENTRGKGSDTRSETDDSPREAERSAEADDTSRSS